MLSAMNKFISHLFSFQFRIFIAITLISTIFVTAAGWVGYHQAHRVVMAQLGMHAADVGTRLTATVEAPPSTGPDHLFPEEEKIVAAVLSRERKATTLINMQNSPKQPAEDLLLIAFTRLETSGRNQNVITFAHRKWFAFRRPLSDGRLLIAVFPAEKWFDQLLVIQKITISFILAVLLLTALLSMLLARSIMKPLLTLRKGIDRIGIGDLSYRVNIHQPDIARDLALSFNKMADSLEKSLIEVKNTHAELQEKEKLAAVGKMTAGIAHEIKNPLGIILGSTQVVLDTKRPWPMREKAASFIMDEVVRLDNTLKAFLDFARPATPILTVINLGEVFEETLTAIEERYQEERYTIHRNFQRDLPLMEADPGQMRQILMNILLNAFNAMPDGGAVTITIRSEKEPEMGLGDSGRHGDKRFISTRNPFTVARDWLIINISDVGCGMKPEMMGKILDPFVSFSDDGIGLGLSIVSQLVKLHRGQMKIDSEPGSGTTFTLYFPCILKETEQIINT
ncbi:HAMP domain-containing protein [Desulforhopalus vacuolatus]|uniref:ATP-binding protein n=1 Tax=Desulforhopalus vacuolatus TaxID=40414 RepID=UPI00196241B4|nr:ATP-binding protein [Desulforhopalus vacuolatus]MBM9519664.1 HAMP domain-containing protein [Desulforhopalus vacuolatus]